jgi:hypothetical protein
MPLGDSITQGGGIGNSGAGYRDTLFTDLNQVHASFTFTGLRNDDASAQLIAAGDEYHNGSSGYEIGDISGNLAGVVTPYYAGAPTNFGGYWLTGGNGTGRGAVDPGIVTLLAGTNDLLFANTIATMENNMDSMLSWFYANRPDTRVIVGTVIPYQQNQFASDDLATAQAKNAQCNAFNTWLKTTEVPKFAGYKVVDLNSLFYSANGTINESLYSTDQLHPNAAGYQVIGNAWAPAVEADLVPEPGAGSLLAGGAGLLAIYLLRRRAAY